MHGRALFAEQAAKLRVGVQVAPVGERRDAQRPPGPGGDQPGFGRVRPGQRAFGVQPGGAGVRAHSQDGRGDRVSGRGHHSHPGWLSQIGGFGRRFQRFVPASGVHVKPCQRGQPAATGTLPARCLDAVHGVLQQADRDRGLVEQPGGGTDSPQRGLVHRGSGDPPQVRGGALLPLPYRVSAGA